MPYQKFGCLRADKFGTFSLSFIFLQINKYPYDKYNVRFVAISCIFSRTFLSYHPKPFSTLPLFDTPPFSFPQINIPTTEIIFFSLLPLLLLFSIEFFLANKIVLILQLFNRNNRGCGAASRPDRKRVVGIEGKGRKRARRISAKFRIRCTVSRCSFSMGIFTSGTRYAIVERT